MPDAKPSLSPDIEIEGCAIHARSVDASAVLAQDRLEF
jgi:hypothetical protein